MFGEEIIDLDFDDSFFQLFDFTITLQLVFDLLTKVFPILIAFDSVFTSWEIANHYTVITRSYQLLINHVFINAELESAIVQK